MSAELLEKPSKEMRKKYKNYLLKNKKPRSFAEWQDELLDRHSRAVPPFKIVQILGESRHLKNLKEYLPRDELVALNHFSAKMQERYNAYVSVQAKSALRMLDRGEPSMTMVLMPSKWKARRIRKGNWSENN